MNRAKLFQFCVFVLSLVSILLFTTCEKDPISSTPLVVVASSPIGPAGGILETTDFSLIVPEGSFTDEVTLNLYNSPEPSSFSESSVSQSFIVEGLPEDFEKSLRLAIKYNGELSDSSYIAYGSISKDFLTGDSTEIYQFISGKDSSGFFIGYLSTRKGINTGKLFRGGKNIDLVGEIFQVVTKYGIIYTDPEHFAINYPKSLYSPGVVTEFGNLLEEIHTELETDLGFRFHFKDTGWCDARNVPGACWIWPIPINIKNVEDKMLGGLNKSKKPPVWYGPYFNVDGILMGSLQNLDARAKIGKNFAALRLLSIKYDTYYYDERKWLGWATYGWLQDYFSNNTIVPYEFSGNELAPFNGLQFGSALETHGHGMVSMIKYLVDTEILALNKIGGIFNTIHEQNIHPVNSLLNNVNGLVADWWPDFFEKLIDGKIFNIDGSVFLNPNFIYGTWPIDKEEDKIKIFSASDVGIVPYPDLSAKMFIVNLNYSGIDESADLYLDAYLSNAANNDGIATLVFSVNNNNLQHLVTAKNSSTLLPKKLKEYYDNGTRKFLVVVVNSTHNATDYLGITDIDLKIEVKKEVPAIYATCEVEVKYRGKIHEVVDIFHLNGTDTDTTRWSNYGFTLPANSEGSFNGNTFSYDYVQAFDNGNTYDIHFTLTLSDDKSEITNIDYTYFHRMDGNAGTSETEVIHNLVSIPLEQADATNNEATYYIGGTETCNSITNVSSSYDHLTFDTFSSTKDLVDYMCDENSYVRVTLK